MCRVPVFIGAVFLAASAFAQPADTNRNPNPDAYTYNRPVEVRTGYGNWGLLGLLGLSGLAGLFRRETRVHGEEDYLNQRGRKVA